MVETVLGVLMVPGSIPGVVSDAGPSKQLKNVETYVLLGAAVQSHCIQISRYFELHTAPCGCRKILYIPSSSLRILFLRNATCKQYIKHVQCIVEGYEALAVLLKI